MFVFGRVLLGLVGAVGTSVVLVAAPAGAATVTNTPAGTVQFSSDIGTLSNLSNAPVPAGGPFGWSFPVGMTGFKVSGVPSGATAKVTFYPLEVTTALFEISGRTFTKVGEIYCDHLDGCSGLTLTLTDGGAGDRDGTANGVIVGQGALAWPYTGAVSTPGGTVTIQSPKGTVLGVTPHQTSFPVPAGAPAGVTFPFDQINFSVQNVPTGATITVLLGLPSPVTDFYQVGCAQKVACRTFTFTKFGGAEVSCETKDNPMPCTLTLTLTDGGAGDQGISPQPNGAIDVSGAPAIVSGSGSSTPPATAAPTTDASAPLPRTGSTSGGLAALGGGIIVAGTVVLAVSRRLIRGTRR